MGLHEVGSIYIGYWHQAGTGSGVETSHIKCSLSTCRAEKLWKVEAEIEVTEENEDQMW